MDAVGPSAGHPDLERLRGRGTYRLCGHPVAVFPHPRGKHCLACVGCESPLCRFKGVAPCPVAPGPTEKRARVFLISPLEVLKGRTKVWPEPSLLGAEHRRRSQPVLIGEAFGASDDGVCGPGVERLGQVRVVLAPRPAELMAIWCEGGRCGGGKGHQMLVVTMAKGRQRFCKEVEGSASLGRCRSKERARAVQSPVGSRAGSRC